MSEEYTLERLKLVLNRKDPLGPTRHELINDPASSAILLNSVDPFSNTIRNDSHVILGRRGCGKSSVVSGYKSLALFGRSHGPISNAVINSSPDHVIPITDWTHFGELVRRVGREAMKKLGDQFDPDGHLHTEDTIPAWEDAYWGVILEHFYSYASKQPRSGTTYSAVFDYANGRNDSLLDRGSSLEDALALRKKAIDCILSNLNGKKIYVLIDSIDEYPLRDRVFHRVFSAFLQSIGRFNSKHENIKVIACVPEEIGDLATMFGIKRNQLKEHSGASRLRWRPIDLLQVLASRYRLTLKVHDKNTEFLDRIDELDFENKLTLRKNLRLFFAHLLPDELVNQLGVSESPIAYIIRHTQLRPREILEIFNGILRHAFNDSSGYRTITSENIVDAVADVEDDLASYVTDIYHSLFSRLLVACDDILPEVPAICNGKTLDKVERRFKGRVESDVSNVWRTLYHMGILGYEDNSGNHHAETSERYVYARFAYNSRSPIPLANDRIYCFHPLFSKRFGMRKSGAYAFKVVYPAGIELDPLAE